MSMIGPAPGTVIFLNNAGGAQGQWTVEQYVCTTSHDGWFLDLKLVRYRPIEFVTPKPKPSRRRVKKAKKGKRK